MKYASLILVAIISKLSILFLEIVPKSFLTSSEYGYFSYYMSIIVLSGSILAFGAPNILIKTQVGKIKNNYDEFVLSFSLSFCLAIILIPLFLFYEYPLIIALNAILFCFLNISSTFFRTQGRQLAWYTSKDISRSFLFAIFTALIFIFKDKLEIVNVSAYYLMIGYSISLAISLLISSKYLYSYSIKDALNVVTIANLFNRLKLSAPLIFTGISYIALSRLDIFFIKDSLGIEAVSDYSAVSRFMYQSLFFQQLILGFSLPKVSEMINSYAYKRVDKLCKKATLIIVASTILSCGIIILILSYEPINSFLKMGPEYLILCAIFALGHVAISAFSFYSYLLLYIGKQHVEYFNSLFMLATAILLYPLAINYLGTFGAALVTVSSVLLGNIFEFIQFRYFKRESFTHS